MVKNYAACIHLFPPYKWKEEGNNTGQNLPFQRKNSKTPDQPMWISYELLPKFQISIIIVSFWLSRLCRKGFYKRNPTSALSKGLTDRVTVAHSLEVATSLRKWEAHGSTDAGNTAPCRDSCVLQVTLHHDTEQREQPYGYCERRRTARRRGRSGNGETVRKLPGKQVFYFFLGKTLKNI